VRFPCVHAAATTPVQRLSVLLAHLTQPCQPSPEGSPGRPAHRPFRGLLGVHSRCGLHTRAVTVFRDPLSEGFRHFVISMPAPVASGWSGCRVGLAPTGKRRLVTAHTHSGRSSPLERRCCSTANLHRLRIISNPEDRQWYRPNGFASFRRFLVLPPSGAPTNGLPRNVVVASRLATKASHQGDNGADDGDRDHDSGRAKGRVFDTFDLERNFADDTFSVSKASAEGSEFRTPPLMGLGRIGAPFLHDARSI
jgi:hypothetical protein